MRVLLIEPPLSPHDIVTGIIGLAEPLGLECIAAPLHGHKVRVLDMRLEKNALHQELVSFRPQIVASGCSTIGVQSTKDILEKAKTFNPSILTVVGGHHASFVPEDFKASYIDAVVMGEGEETFRKLLETFEGNGDFSQIPGLALPDQENMYRTEERPLLDLNNLPYAARNLVQRYRKHYFRGKWRPVTSIFTSRGCPFRCSFCAMWKINRGKYRVRNPVHVVEELESIPEFYIEFLDDNSFENVNWAWELRDLLVKRGIHKRYKVYSRSDTVANNPDLIRAWNDVGLEIVLVGFESFREQELNDYNKRNSVEQNERAIRVLKECDLETAAYFVVNPDFAEEDFAALKRYVEEQELLHPVFTMLTPFPGTDLHESNRDKLQDMDYEKLDFFHAVLPTKLPLKCFYEEFTELYHHAYSLKRVLRSIHKQKFTGLSIQQMIMRRRFFSRLSRLVREAR